MVIGDLTAKLEGGDKEGNVLKMRRRRPQIQMGAARTFVTFWFVGIWILCLVCLLLVYIFAPGKVLRMSVKRKGP